MKTMKIYTHQSRLQDARQTILASLRSREASRIAVAPAKAINAPLKNGGME